MAYKPIKMILNVGISFTSTGRTACTPPARQEKQTLIWLESLTCHYGVQQVLRYNKCLCQRQCAETHLSLGLEQCWWISRCCSLFPSWKREAKFSLHLLSVVYRFYRPKYDKIHFTSKFYLEKVPFCCIISMCSTSEKRGSSFPSPTYLLRRKADSLISRDKISLNIAMWKKKENDVLCRFEDRNCTISVGGVSKQWQRIQD